MQLEKENSLDGKTARFAIRVTPAVRKKVEELAKKDNRKISNWCENAIVEKIEREERK